MTTSEATFSLSVPPPPSPPYGFLLDGFVVEEMSQYPLARRHEPSDLEGAARSLAWLGVGRTILSAVASNLEGVEVCSNWEPAGGAWGTWK
jgi:hypothetical protein